MNVPLPDMSFQALFDAMTEALLLVDQTGRIVMANSATCTLLGYAQHEMYGMAAEMLIPEHLRKQHRMHCNVYFSSPRKRSMAEGSNFRVLTKDGHELPLNIGLTPLKVEQQSWVIVTLHADRRHLAEDALKLSQGRLLLAQHAAAFGIFDWDLIHGTLHMDQCMRELWGESSEEAATITNEKLESHIHPDDRAASRVAYQQAIDPAGDGSYKTEYRIKRANIGDERWITSIGQVYFENGQASRLTGIARDITDQKAMEQKFLEQRDETDSILKLQIATQTASAIAHEINQPLTAISAYSEVALRALKNSHMSTENLSRALEGCVEQAQRAGKTLHELLDFLHQGELEVEPLDINALIRETFPIAKKDFYGGVNIELHLEQGIPLVLGNHLRIQKVLLNLLRNGIEASRGAGLTAEIAIKVNTTAEKNMARVTVQDRGPGIDAITVQRIFDPFFTTKRNGIGMGLAISRALVEAHCGQLWLDPESDQGTTFHFTLPFA